MKKQLSKQNKTLNKRQANKPPHEHKPVYQNDCPPTQDDFQPRNFISANEISPQNMHQLFKIANKHLENSPHILAKSKILQGRIIFNLFFENSTRTGSSFEIAAKSLGADVINVNLTNSSMKKGESLFDTIKTINAMKPDAIIIRHNESGVAQSICQYTSAKVINAGDGTNEHPSQALLDMFTIYKRFDCDISALKGKIICICGDIKHSRVAKSNIILAQKLGMEVRLIAPKTLLPRYLYQDYKILPSQPTSLSSSQPTSQIVATNIPVTKFNNMEQGLLAADVIMMLRIQQERMVNSCFLPSINEYSHFYGLNRKKLALAKKNAFVMHPGPANRGIEITTDILDDASICEILNQVEYGIAIRKSMLQSMFGN